MKKLYIFKVGQTFENTHNHLGDFVDWINNFNDDKTVQIETIDILQGDDLPSLNETKGVIITGSHSMVTDNLPWSIKTEQWIQEASHVKIPILGICYGHQLIAKALGGKVEDNPNGKEIGTVKIYTSSEIKKDRLFSANPFGNKTSGDWKNTAFDITYAFSGALKGFTASLQYEKEDNDKLVSGVASNVTSDEYRFRANYKF